MKQQKKRKIIGTINKIDIVSVGFVSIVFGIAVIGIFIVFI